MRWLLIRLDFRFGWKDGHLVWISNTLLDLYSPTPLT